MAQPFNGTANVPARELIPEQIGSDPSVTVGADTLARLQIFEDIGAALRICDRARNTIRTAQRRGARPATGEARAGGPVADGSTVGGNGMICRQFRGGTGTASRRVAIGGQDCTMAAPVQADHGIFPWLTVLGRPVGRPMPEGRLLEAETGSIVVVPGPDAPLSGLSLRQLARHAPIGIGRGGTPGGDNSGDILLAFSIADEGPMPQFAAAVLTRREIDDERPDPLSLAAVEAIEASGVNALVAGGDALTVEPAGRLCRALPTGRLRTLFAEA